ncbi:unnamed protein product [Adineta ricciae]|uniref:Uncharacterized protein n=1 Tax=Adineta ricciae TaxID=249248 RepID=A0A816C9L5_ADIRI|nr:unnamed protein product [Adineta ricciae]CAF1618566.1 unnamed protein product [Adineta ricciae]
MKLANCTLLCLLLVTVFVANQALDRGDIILEHDFDGSKKQIYWKGFLGSLIQLVTTDRGNQALRIEQYQKNALTAWVALPLPVSIISGCKIRIQTIVKAENISLPPNIWNGIKVMLQIQAPSGDNYPQQNLLQGTFEWRLVDFITRIPNDARQVTIYKKPRSHPPSIPSTGLPYKGHSLPRLRGAMIGTNLKEKDFRDFGSWNANHIR